MAGKLTLTQFEAVAELLRLRPTSTAYQVARSVYVDGLSIGDAARHNETTYNAAHQAAKRVERGLELAQKAAG